MNSPAGPRSGSPAAVKGTRPFVWWLLLGLVLAAGALLRFYRLDDQSLWYDEGWSLHVAEQSLRDAAVLPSSPGHTHPPLYYLALWCWVRIWGHSDTAARALSAALGALTPLVGWCYGLIVRRRSTGLVATLLLALSPALLLYSQEVRMYALLVLLYGLILLLHVEALRDGFRWQRSRLVALALAEAALAYTHYFGLVAIAGVAVCSLAVHLARRDHAHPRLANVGSYLVSQVAAALLFAPYLPSALAPAVEHTTIGALPPTPIAFLRETWAFLVGGAHCALGS